MGFLALLMVGASAVPTVALSGRVPTHYPEAAVQNCTEGFVRVQYTFSPQGQPEDIEILEASPVGVFEDATRKNLSYWRFPHRAGETETQTIEYRLENVESCNS